MRTFEQTKWMTGVGWLLSGLVGLTLLAGGIVKVTAAPEAVDKFTHHLGYQASTLRPIGAVELIATALFLVPRTRIVGAILLTGHLGGAMATHVRLGEPFAAPLVLAILAWVGLALRDARLRILLASRRDKIRGVDD